MSESQKKEKDDDNKNQSEEHNEGKLKKNTKGECDIQTGQIKENEGSASKCSIQEGKDEDYHVQQGIREGTMDSSNTIITPLKKNKRKSSEKMIQNERSKGSNENKKEKEQVVSFEEQRPKQQQQEEEKDINDELEFNIITSDDSLLNNTDHIRKDNNTDSDLKLPISDEKDQNYYRLKQGVPKNTKFRSIIDIYKHTKRLSSPALEYTWRRLSTLENQKSKVHNEREGGKDQVNTIQEILPNKQKRKSIDGEFQRLDEHSQEDNIDSGPNLSTKKNNDEEEDLNKGKSESTIFKSLFDLCEVIIEHETSDRNISRKDPEEPIEEEQQQIEEEQQEVEEEQAEEQQQQPNDNTGEPELNKVTGEDSLPNIDPDHVLNDNVPNCGSKLLTRDENSGNYHITQGIPRSIKFRSISNLYQCTTRLSLIEDEYNWNTPRGEDSNVNRLKKEDSSDKKNSGCKRKCRENKKGSGEKDATT